jgi:hypothetical protein
MIKAQIIKGRKNQVYFYELLCLLILEQRKIT